MVKIIISIVAFGILYFVFFKPKPNKNSKDKNEKLEAQNFVECSSCGTFVDCDEAILSNGKYICKDCFK